MKEKSPHPRMTKIREIGTLIRKGNPAQVHKIFFQDPTLLEQAPPESPSWLHEAVKCRQIEMVDYFLDRGLDLNTVDRETETSPLITAIENDDITMMRFLLAKGANPNLGRPLIAAINCISEEHGLEMVAALVEAGADVNQTLGCGKGKPKMTALGWATKNEKWGLVEFLEEHGGIKTDAANDEAEPPLEPIFEPEIDIIEETKSRADEIVQFFTEKFGPTSSKSLIELVPGDLPITVHVIPAGKGRPHQTLFTTGMSDREMKTPDGREEYRLAEMFVQLPADWSCINLMDASRAWPIHWLRSMAKYPHRHDTWLGAPATILSNGYPPEPLAPSLPYTSLLLVAEMALICSDSRHVQCYRMFPLFTEERNFEIKRDIAALLKAFEKFRIPLVVDLKRPNVGDDSHSGNGRFVDNNEWYSN